MQTKIQVKRNQNSFDITSSTVVLAYGEPFFNNVNNNLYVGDGSTQTKSLKPVGYNSNPPISGANYTFNGSTCVIGGFVASANGLTNENGAIIAKTIKASNSITANTLNASMIQAGTISATGDIVTTQKVTANKLKGTLDESDINKPTTIILDSNTYGTSFPQNPVAGQLFFKKV